MQCDVSKPGGRAGLQGRRLLQEARAPSDELVEGALKAGMKKR